MAILTNFLKLLKPEKNDYVDVDKHISENYDKIDSKMQELSTSNSGKLDKGAVSTEYDTAKKIEDKIKAAQGTADNKLNKGSLPATIPDGKTIYDLLENNGGINIDTALLYLNDAGTKTQGKVYFDRNKKGLFECIQTTTSTTNSTTYFVDISNKASADRLANLLNLESTGITLDSKVDAKVQNDKIKNIKLAYIINNVYGSIPIFNIKNGEQSFRIEDTQYISQYHINFLTGTIRCSAAQTTRHNIDNIYIIR